MPSACTWPSENENSRNMKARRWQVYSCALLSKEERQTIRQTDRQTDR